MAGLFMKYFVLKPSGTSQYAKASRAAMIAYARCIMDVNTELHNELMEWVQREKDIADKAIDLMIG